MRNGRSACWLVDTSVHLCEWIIIFIYRMENKINVQSYLPWTSLSCIARTISLHFTALHRTDQFSPVRSDQFAPAAPPVLNGTRSLVS